MAFGTRKYVPTDVPEIVEEHMVNGRVVERLAARVPLQSLRKTA